MHTIELIMTCLKSN